jgi:hypothetical protein
MQISQPTPEEAELKKKFNELEDLTSKMAQKELELAILEGELSAFENKYLSIVGKRIADLDDIEAQIAQKMAIKYPRDINIQQDLNFARTRSRESSQSTKFIDSEKEIKPRFIPTESIKNLYRELAKQIHPDLAVDDDDRASREELMKLANRAFQEGNEAALRSILEQWQISPDRVSGGGIGAELIRTIRRISLAEERIALIEEELKKIKELDIYRLMKEVENARETGSDLISQMASELDKRIAEKRKYLISMDW